MLGYISDLPWVMLQYTYLVYSKFIPYMESHNWVNAKNLNSYVFPHALIVLYKAVYILRVRKRF